MSKITNDGLSHDAVPTWQQWASKGQCHQHTSTITISILRAIDVFAPSVDGVALLGDRSRSVDSGTKGFVLTTESATLSIDSVVLSVVSAGWVTH